MSIKFLIGDVFEQLATLPDESVDCIVTSPPYWGLRKYVEDDDPNKKYEIGLEPTFQEHLEVIVRVMREGRRVLKKDGTCWFNYGDAYATGTTAARTEEQGGNKLLSKGTSRSQNIKRIGTPKGLKTKDLIQMPSRISIALCDDGWWVRSEVVWNKPNPMPESVKDRPATAHEKIFLLTKSARYFYDHEAVKEPIAASTINRGPVDFGGEKGRGYTPNSDDPNFRNGKEQWGRTYDYEISNADGKRTLKNVWTMTTKPFPEAHFATFPPELAETCIKAGCPKGGVVLDPFAGAGTTGLVADRLGRDAILIELNPDYMEMAKRRLEDDAGMFMETAQ